MSHFLVKTVLSSIYDYIESKGFMGGTVGRRSIRESRAAQPQNNIKVNKNQLAMDRKALILLMLSVNENRIKEIEKTKKRIWELLREAKEWKSQRQLGPLSVYGPGDITKYGLTGVADWVKPKSSSLGSALVSNAKSPFAAIVIFVSTPTLLLCDTVISASREARRVIGKAPPGAYLPIGKERQLCRILDVLYKEIHTLSTCQVGVHP